jgi:HEAT repeat protein
MTRKRFLTTMLFILVGAAALGCWQRQPILAWWRVHQLMQATESQRSACVDAVAALDQAALPRLVSGLTTSDATSCSNLEEALVELAKRWKALDPRALVLLESLHADFAKFSLEGQATGLRTATALLSTAAEGEMLPAGITLSASGLLKGAERSPTLRPLMLHLAGALLDRVPPGQWLDEARNWASQGLAAADSTTRAAALHLTMRAALRGESNLLTQALPLLRDPEAIVRRAAVIALGSREDGASEDDLLPLLHDSDAEVQQLCELALRGRGLQDRQLELARLISDESPAARLRVLQLLRAGSDVELGVWLRRLSQDPAPAVRAAAVRAAAAQPQIDLRERMTEMTRHDASPTVRELAAHYLTLRDAKKPSEPR